MDTYFFSAFQLHQIATRSLHWLLSLQQRVGADTQFTGRHALQILLGLWICEQGLLNDTQLSSTRSYIVNMNQKLLEGSSAATDLLSSDPALSLFSLGIMRFFNVHHEQFEYFAVHISKLLQAHADQNDEEANELFLTRFLLQQLHLHPPVRPYPLQEISARKLISADEGTLRYIVKNIVAATQFGQRMPSMKSDFQSLLSSLFPVLTLDYFRLYNLEMGMQMLRAMHYLHLERDKRWETGLQFLAAQ